jgi:hypothetical protein
MKARISYNDQTDNDFNIVTKGEFEAAPRSDRALDAITGIPAKDIDFGGALGGWRKDWLGYVNSHFKLSDKVSADVNPYYQTLEGRILPLSGSPARPHRRRSPRGDQLQRQWRRGASDLDDDAQQQRGRRTRRHARHAA